MQKLHAERPQQARESNPQPSCRGATALTTAAAATMETLKKTTKAVTSDPSATELHHESERDNRQRRKTQHKPFCYVNADLAI